MVSMKRDLLTIVQDMLVELNGDEVTSITDTIEATELANIVATTYFDLISHREIPEHKELFRLEDVAGSTAHLKIPDDVDIVETLRYNKSDDSRVEYRDVHWKDPEVFLRFLDRRDNTQSNVEVVNDVNGSTELLIKNDKMPDFFTSFDDENIVLDSYDSSVDASGVVGSKSRAFGKKIPTVTISDGFTFDLDSDYFQYLYNEALSRAFVAQQKTENPKAEQWARRHKSAIQNNKWRVEQPNRRQTYGRT